MPEVSSIVRGRGADNEDVGERNDERLGQLHLAEQSNEEDGDPWDELVTNVFSIFALVAHFDVPQCTLPRIHGAQSDDKDQLGRNISKTYGLGFGVSSSVFLFQPDEADQRLATRHAPGENIELSLG